MALFNTHLVTRRNFFCTFRPGGIAVNLGIAYGISVLRHTPLVELPVMVAVVFASALTVDFLFGVKNTMTELHVIDTLGGSNGNSGEARKEEGRPRGEEGEGGTGASA